MNLQNNNKSNLGLVLWNFSKRINTEMPDACIYWIKCVC